jgi:hypothetical protein
VKAGARPAKNARRKRLYRLAGKIGGLLAPSLFLFAFPLLGQAQETEHLALPRTNLGGVGLIEMPSARMAPDAELSAGASFFTDTQHYNLGFQILPWLEGSFRYSGLQHFDPSYPVYWDRSFGIKARLLKEDGFLPALSLGINDVVGTGVYSSEYIVASKQFGDFDATLGAGWGRLGGANNFRNQIAQIFPSYERRATLTSPGGTNVNVFFHGPNMGLFGGVSWRTPVSGLSLIVETSSDNYPFERDAGNFKPHTQMNYGLSYQASDNITLGLNWLYGRAIGGNVSFQFDPKKPQYPQKIDPPPPPVTVRSDEERQQALAVMLESRDPRDARRARLLETRNATRNNFVDALWKLGGDYASVEIQSSVLELTVTGAISSNRCAATARLMQGVATSITRVRLHDGGERRGLSCSVPRTVEGPLVSAALLSARDFVQLPAMPVLTIDASAVSGVQDRAQIEHNVRAAITGQNLFVDALSVGNSEVLLYYRNGHYLAETDAIDRIVRVLTKEAPPKIERFRLIAVQNGVPQQEFDVLRSPVERSYQQEDGTVFDHSVRIRPPAMDQPVLAAATDIYPRFGWGLYPQFRQALFDPNQPFGVQFLAVAGAGVELARGLSVSGSVEASLYDNFDTSRTSDSVLPHVRSDFMKYFTQGKTGIGHLAADYRFRVTPTIFARVHTGYLESMFAGAGGEILWRPQGARWALGADVYQVWQRDFDRLFGVQHYHQTTGHVSIYYDSPWYDLNFELRAGKYLAGDRGFTFQVTRRFSTGVEVGAFFTKTNVPSQQFGEGSFDKGIIIRIPLGWIAPLETQSELGMDLRPVQRDGGQTLGADATLYEETRATSEGEIVRSGKYFSDN